ncbi:hypothetical protein SPF06_10010 [Sinomonas sp. JGH33]|uniref:Uncharacterized protein n=1 Tax=Sinomonas terricola TaxID=3110330 RepID=A0ABU5T685_9MICC|nr:hypothetical protein [Sinomonas sp. JGH33]MEA5455052.1 hypothetical protein [Sinomonas sp. JGH33]
MTYASPALPGTTRRTGFRATGALSAGAAGLALVGAGAWLPWLTVFNGLTTIRGFALDGGYLAGIALLAAGMLVLAGRRGGSAFLRPLAMIGCTVVLGDSLFSGWRIASYVGDPGPAAGLVMPVAGIGPLVMAVGGLALLFAGAVAPLGRRRLEPGLGLPLVLAVALFTAGWIHVVLAPEHFAESLLLGVGFLASGLMQIALSSLVVGRPRDGVLSLSIATNVALIALYAYAVLVGLPGDGGADSAHATGLIIGSGEAIEPTGVAAKLAELVALAFAIVLLRRSSTAAARPSPEAPLGAPGQADSANG